MRFSFLAVFCERSVDSSRIYHHFNLPPTFSFALQIDLTLQSEEGGDISNFNTNGEWDLLGIDVFIPLFIASMIVDLV